MSFAQIVARGWQAPVARGCAVQQAYRLQASAARFGTLMQTLTDRTSKIRAAHRRHLRRLGQPLTPLTPARKYRASKRINQYMVMQGNF